MCRICTLAVVVGLVGVFAQFAHAQQWASKGLTGKKIACMTVDDSGRVMAGTTNVFDDTMHAEHLYVGNDRTNTSFQMVSYSLPIDIKAIARANSGQFTTNAGQYIAVGLGWYEVDGDGIFVTNGMSSAPFYTVGRTNRFVAPSAVTVRVVSGPTRDTVSVFVSNGRYIGRGLLRYGSVTLDTIKKIPANPFGATKPWCAAMCIYGADRRCFAGGYDTSGTGSGNLLGEVTPDSFAVVKADVKVTALHAGSKYLYVGTRDDGLYRYEGPASVGGVGTWTHAAGPAAEPITGIVAVPNSPTDDVVYVAVTSGVYTTLSSQTVAWTKLGTLAAQPRNLALGKTAGDLYAGTNDGVWYISDPIAMAAQPATHGTTTVPAVHFSVSRTTIDFQVEAVSGGQLSIRLHDFSGRMIASRKAVTGAVSFGKPAGPCLYRLEDRGAVLKSGMVTAQ